MSRVSDWETALHDYVASVQGKLFAWGEHDCYHHICNAAQAVTGGDLLGEHRGRYKTELGAARLLRRVNGIDGFLSNLLEVCEPAFARRGDIALHDGAGGIVMGDYALFVGDTVSEDGVERGLVRVPRSEWEAAWHV